MRTLLLHHLKYGILNAVKFYFIIDVFSYLPDAVIIIIFFNCVILIFYLLLLLAIDFIFRH